MAATTQKSLKRSEYMVAIICPLEVEMSAVRYLLDDEHTPLPSKDGDKNRYVFGEMSGCNVIIGFLPYGSKGIGAAATVATSMRHNFPAIQLRLLVGIGGGVPSLRNDIRLGDVVVGMPEGIHGGVVQYDLGREMTTGFERKGWLEPPPKCWRNAIVVMQSDHRAKGNRISGFLSEMISRYPPLKEFQRPAPEKDILFRPNNTHVAKQATCEECDKTQIIKRTARQPDGPAIFYGLIASGDLVMKNAEVRDEISQHAGGALCFEMEAAGLVNDFHCVVIRGIADYADSHKNDDWHRYAAAVAAGCAKELLTYMVSDNVPEPIPRPPSGEPESNPKVVNPDDANDGTASPNPLKQLDFMMAVLEGRNDDVERYLRGNQHRININETESTQGQPPITIAVVLNHVSTVKSLIAAGADVNIPDKNGFAPLGHALKNTNLELMKILLDAKADTLPQVLPNWPIYGPNTYLTEAVRMGRGDIVDLLVKANVDINNPAHIDGGTWAAASSPLVKASFNHRDASMTRRLLEAHADPNAPSGCKTPLLAAARPGNAENVKLLLEYDADPDLQHWGHRPRDALESNQELRKILLRHEITRSMKEKAKA